MNNEHDKECIVPSANEIVSGVAKYLNIEENTETIEQDKECIVPSANEIVSGVAKYLNIEENTETTETTETTEGTETSKITEVEKSTVGSDSNSRLEESIEGEGRKTVEDADKLIERVNKFNEELKIKKKASEKIDAEIEHRRRNLESLCKEIGIEIDEIEEKFIDTVQRVSIQLEEGTKALKDSEKGDIQNELRILKTEDKAGELLG